MPDPQTPAAPAKPAAAVKSFKDPDFLAKLDAGYKNTEAIAAGKPPTTPTDDSPADTSQPTDGAAPAGAATQPAAASDSSAAGSPSHTATQPADPPYSPGAKNWEALRTRHKEEM